MPQMQIEGPNGQVATLNIPEGATPEQIQAHASRIKQQMQEKATKPPEEATAPREEGMLVEAARNVESVLDNFVLDGAERMGLLEEIAKTPIEDDGESTFDERVMARQQAMWDEVPPAHKFLIGVGQSVDTFKDWGLDAIGFGDEEARAAEDAVFNALDENNQDASDAGQLVGELAQLYAGGAALKGIGAIGAYAFKLGRGGVGRTRQLLQFFSKYDPKTLEKVAKTKAGQNLLKASKASDEAADVAARGLAKKADAIDDAVRKTQTLKVNRNPKGKNPMELRAEMNANVARGTERAREAQQTAAREVQEKMAMAQKRAEEAASRLKAQKQAKAAEQAREAARQRQVDQASRRANATTASAKKPTPPRKSNAQGGRGEQIRSNRAANRKQRRAETREAIKRSPGGF